MVVRVSGAWPCGRRPDTPCFVRVARFVCGDDGGRRTASCRSRNRSVRWASSPGHESPRKARRSSLVAGNVASLRRLDEFPHLPIQGASRPIPQLFISRPNPHNQSCRGISTRKAGCIVAWIGSVEGAPNRHRRTPAPFTCNHASAKGLRKQRRHAIWRIARPTVAVQSPILDSLPRRRGFRFCVRRWTILSNWRSTARCTPRGASTGWKRN
jgi:hypothetical protein